MLESWTELYSNSAVLRTAVLYAHVAGLLIGGGAAVATDRLTLMAPPNDAHQLRVVAGVHRLVVVAIAAMAASGVLMLAANLETYLVSKVFWTKMLLVVLLLSNGLRLLAAEAAVRRGAASGWGRLRSASITSLVLWLLIALFGAMLPNV
ncbi:MAG: hypothetical protein EPO35_04505 [Acidobacteria bacterium]|nr:MAG: hypothetical protein EPO35_04505 [Acidobacteriota bacterium]